MGNSPRLPAENLPCLSRQFTIGVNRILRTGFTPTVILWVDASVYADDGPVMDASDAVLICDRSVACRPSHVGLTAWVGEAALTHGASPAELLVSGNTGCGAARWAIALGCPCVYLLGMEAAYKDGQTDFWGVNLHHRGGATLNVMRKELARLRADFPDRVVDVPDGRCLRRIVADWPDQDPDALKRQVLAAIAGTGKDKTQH